MRACVRACVRACARAFVRACVKACVRASVRMRVRASVRYVDASTREGNCASVLLVTTARAQSDSAVPRPHRSTRAQPASCRATNSDDACLTCLDHNSRRDIVRWCCHG